MSKTTRVYKLPLLLASVSFVLTGAGGISVAGEVNITADLPYVDLTIDGQEIRIERIQDTDHKLTNSFSKTSRKCPPFCIHPMKAADGVETVGEIELISFLQDHVVAGKGLLVDARIPTWYRKGTIPGSVNIPFTLLSPGENPYIGRILNALGSRKVETDKWDHTDSRELLLFCNGPWCDQSPRAIRNLISVGYPANKLRYYRGGMQAWQAMGLKTAIPGESPKAVDPKVSQKDKKKAGVQ